MSERIVQSKMPWVSGSTSPSRYQDGTLLTTSPVTKNITQTECGFPVEDDFAAVKIMRLVLFFTLPTFAIIIRLVVKIARMSPWGFDDSTILLTYVSYGPKMGEYVSKEKSNP